MGYSIKNLYIMKKEQYNKRDGDIKVSPSLFKISVNIVALPVKLINRNLPQQFLYHYLQGGI